jgi:nucleotide-binding universal stress UspA family protein
MRLGTIVVATDFSAEAERATGHAIALARRSGARIVLCHVETAVEPLEVGLAPDGTTLPAFLTFVQEEVVESRRLIEAAAARVAGAGVAIETSVVRGFPDSAIVELAHDRRAELLVLASHGRSGVSRVLLGSVTEKVVRTFERAVLVARGEPPTSTSGGYRRILVPTDFTPRAERALRFALGLAAPDAEIVLFHAWQLSFGHYLPGESTDTLLAPVKGAVVGAAEEKAAALMAVHADAPVRLRFEIAEGGAGRAIEVRAAGVDLVVMGSHGRRGFRRWLLGSLAEATVRAAPCSVVVVHGPDDDGDAG